MSDESEKAGFRAPFWINSASTSMTARTPAKSCCGSSWARQGRRQQGSHAQSAASRLAMLATRSSGKSALQNGSFPIPLPKVNPGQSRSIKVHALTGASR